MKFAEAVAVAARAFRDSRDRSGGFRLTHGLEVAGALSPTASPSELATAILHDVLEDTDWSADDLDSAGVEAIVLEAVESLTHWPDETYEEFIDRVCSAPGEAGEIARAVKLADLTVNLERADSQELRDRYERALPLIRAASQGGTVSSRP